MQIVTFYYWLFLSTAPQVITDNKYLRHFLVLSLKKIMKNCYTQLFAFSKFIAKKKSGSMLMRVLNFEHSNLC